MNSLINCKIPIKFPIVPNKNGFYFSKSSLENIGSQLSNTPILRDEKPIGMLSDRFTFHIDDREIVLIVDGTIYAQYFEVYPEIKVFQTSEGRIESFSFEGVSL